MICGVDYFWGARQCPSLLGQRVWGKGVDLKIVASSSDLLVASNALIKHMPSRDNAGDSNQDFSATAHHYIPSLLQDLLCSMLDVV